jgi:hypothetical protein
MLLISITKATNEAKVRTIYIIDQRVRHNIALMNNEEGKAYDPKALKMIDNGIAEPKDS